MMNLVITSSDEKYTLRMILVTVLKLPETVNWKILGDVSAHSTLAAIFGEEKFLPILQSEITDIKNSNYTFLNLLSEKHMFVPTDYSSLKFLIQSLHVLKNHEVCPLMNFDILAFLDDKLNQTKICDASQLLSPEEYSYEQLKKLPHEQKVVIKPHLGSGSEGVVVFENTDSALNYYEALDSNLQKKQIIQKYVDGKDYYYYALCLNGEIFLSGIILPNKKNPIQNVLPASLDFDQESLKLIKHYNYSGPISIDYRVDAETKKIYLIEINPRNGANCYLFSSININWLYELACLTDKKIQNLSYNNIKKLTWHIQLIKFFRLAKLYFLFRLKIYKLPLLAKLLI